jgi:lipopolysaccharide biosynthesis regulator YciM
MYSCDASKHHHAVSINSVFELKLDEYSKATLYDPAERVYSLVTNTVIPRHRHEHASSLNFFYDVSNKVGNKSVPYHIKLCCINYEKISLNIDSKYYCKYQNVVILLWAILYL